MIHVTSAVLLRLWMAAVAVIVLTIFINVRPGWGQQFHSEQSPDKASPPTTAAVISAADCQFFAASVKPFLKQHCLECHSEKKPAGQLRLDQITDDFQSETNRKRWLHIRQRIKSGEMPPKSKPRPVELASDLVLDWIHNQSKATEIAEQAAQGRVILRRLNRVEYENTIRDLLQIEIELQELLPVDSSANGFDNVGEALHTSSFLMDKYLEAADRSLNLAVANFPKPTLVKKRISLKDTHQVKSTTESVYRKMDADGLIMFSSSAWNSIVLSPFYPPDRGKYRFRISAAGFQSDGKPVTFRIDAGPMLMATKNHMVGYFDAPGAAPAILEFTDHLEARSTIRISPLGLATAHEVNKIGADKYSGAGLFVEWVEVEGPLHEVWPPVSHRRIFGDLPQSPAKTRDSSQRVEVMSDTPTQDAREILMRFCRRAFRRAVTESEIQPLLELIEQKRVEGYSFEQAVRVGLKGALVSPAFLFLNERPGQLDDFALASRLSYFLWSSMPDEELLNLAEAGKLNQPEILRQQTQRLLAHPKASAFTENFVGQWLGLREIDSTEPDRLLYPEFDDLLRTAMVQESQLFFLELLREDLSLTNFISSDFTMLNERLARHYGIPGVTGHAFRRVQLPADSHRGGVMTMASVLKVTANGTSTSPVVRGAWVLDRILGTPPAPPPAGVPAVEPDIRGATTIREQLSKHREIEACASCHIHIDPPGFALESFDVIGGWREHYRSLGRGEPVSIQGRRMPYARGPAVDPADQLPDGRSFQNIDEFKRLLLVDPDQSAKAFTSKLVTYATGRAPTELDLPEIDAIVSQIRGKNYGLRSLVHEVIQSRLFQFK